MTKQVNGYTIDSAGEIYSPKGKMLQAYDITYEKSHVTMIIDGHIYKKNKAILIYNTFSKIPLNTKTEFLQFKDGNKANAAFDNLIKYNKKDFYAINPIKRITEEDKKKIIAEHEQGVSLRKLARKNECALYTIQRIISAGIGET